VNVSLGEVQQFLGYHPIECSSEDIRSSIINRSSYGIVDHNSISVNEIISIRPITSSTSDSGSDSTVSIEDSSSAIEENVVVQVDNTPVSDNRAIVIYNRVMEGLNNIRGADVHNVFSTDVNRALTRFQYEMLPLLYPESYTIEDL